MDTMEVDTIKGNTVVVAPMAPIVTRGELVNAQLAAESIIDSIYDTINQFWNEYLGFPGTYILRHNPYRNVERWRNSARHRYHELEGQLGQITLIIAMYSRQFVRKIVAGRESDSLPEIYRNQVVVDHLIANHASLKAFAVLRSSLLVDWFAFYNASGLADASGLSAVSGSTLNNVLPRLEANHPFEIYRASNGSLKRSTFLNTYNRTIRMDNIKDNIYCRENFTDWVPQPERPTQWPNNQPFPADPSNFIRHHGKGIWPICYQCDERTGKFRGSCKCTPTMRDIHPCIEIKQYRTYPGHNNRGVRALSSIMKDTMIGEYNGEFVPYGIQDHRPWGEEDYALDWDAPYHLDGDGYQLDAPYQYDIEPIATLIGGRNGSWTRFINHTRHRDKQNLRFWPVAFGGKYRIIVETIRDIEFGEELLVDYGDDFGSEGDAPKWL